MVFVPVQPSSSPRRPTCRPLGPSLHHHPRPGHRTGRRASPLPVDGHLAGSACYCRRMSFGSQRPQDGDSRDPARRPVRSRHGLRLLEHVSTLIGESENLQETLDSVVQVVAERMHTEACSVYLLDESSSTLTLWATTGLETSAVGRVKMLVDRGSDRPRHRDHAAGRRAGRAGPPALQVLPGDRTRSATTRSSASRCSSAARRSACSSSRRCAAASSPPTRSACCAPSPASSRACSCRRGCSTASRSRSRSRPTSAAACSTRSGACRPSSARPSAAPRPSIDRDPGERLRGIGASPGFGIGRVHILHPQIEFSEIDDRACEDPVAEVERFEGALAIATRDLERQREKMNEILPEATSQIFDAHLLMMRDDAVAARVRDADPGGHVGRVRAAPRDRGLPGRRSSASRTPTSRSGRST